MNSMTGYGKADFRNPKIGLSISISSVNGRFLECTVRLPRQIGFLEPKIRELVATKINRGKIVLSLSYDDFGLGIDRLNVNQNLVGELYTQLTKLKKKYKLGGDIEIGHLASFPDIFRIEKAENIETKIWKHVETTVKKALDDLIAMRKREGVNLKKDFITRLKTLTTTTAKIEKLARENIPIYREKLAKKINDVLNGKAVDNRRLEEEVIFYAERSDITEECIRLKSHILQFNTDIKRKGPIGKRLNFILQELNRESNTIGAKTGHKDISRLVLTLKEEIEKMREQVQNIE